MLGEKDVPADQAAPAAGVALAVVLTRARNFSLPVLPEEQWRRILATAVEERWWVEVTPHGDGVDDPVWVAWRRGRPHYADALLARSMAWNAQRGRGQGRIRRLWVPHGPFQGDQVYLRDVLRARARAGQSVRVLDSATISGWVEGEQVQDLVVIPGQGVFAPSYSDGVPSGALWLADTRLARAVAGELTLLWERATPMEWWMIPA